MKRIMLVLGLGMSCSISAGEYFLIDMADRKDRDIHDLCPKLVENFKRYASEPPMVCVRKFDPAFSEIRFPLWESVNDQDSLADIKRLLLDESANSKFFNTFEKLYQKNGIKVEKSRFDFNSDGITNTVFRLTVPKYQFECDDESDNQGIHENALRIRYLVEQNQKQKGSSSGFRAVNGRVSGGVFLYGNRPYFHSWRNGPVMESKESKAYKWPFPRIVIKSGGPIYDFKESFYARPICEIGYRNN